MFEFGEIVWLGKASWPGDRAVCAAQVRAALFFITVNQVLVRLWARVSGFVLVCVFGLSTDR